MHSGAPGSLYYVTTQDGQISFEQDGRNFISEFSRNAGPRENYAYTRGNPTRITYAGGLRSVLAEYPDSCTPATRKICNLPTRTRDSNGNWTDYTYHAPSGQIESITYPANEHGVRPQKRFQYTQLSAQYYDANGNWITGSPIWVKTAEEY